MQHHYPKYFLFIKWGARARFPTTPKIAPHHLRHLLHVRLYEAATSCRYFPCKGKSSGKEPSVFYSTKIILDKPQFLKNVFPGLKELNWNVCRIFNNFSDQKSTPLIFIVLYWFPASYFNVLQFWYAFTFYWEIRLGGNHMFKNQMRKHRDSSHNWTFVIHLGGSIIKKTAPKRWHIQSCAKPFSTSFYPLKTHSSQLPKMEEYITRNVTKSLLRLLVIWRTWTR